MTYLFIFRFLLRKKIIMIYLFSHFIMKILREKDDDLFIFRFHYRDYFIICLFQNVSKKENFMIILFLVISNNIKKIFIFNIENF
jgi:hypothetical protein